MKKRDRLLIVAIVFIISTGLVYAACPSGPQCPHGVCICDVMYNCGVNDGVCPEDYEADCLDASCTYPDPDCGQTCDPSKPINERCDTNTKEYCDSDGKWKSNLYCTYCGDYHCPDGACNCGETQASCCNDCGGCGAGSDPFGSLDWVTCDLAAGWACDPDTTGGFPVHFYASTSPATQGTMVGYAVTSSTRPDVCAAFNPNCCGDVAFGFYLPDSVKDGQVYYLRAYAINVGGGSNNAELGGSPKQFGPCTRCPGQYDIWRRCYNGCTTSWDDYSCSNTQSNCVYNYNEYPRDTWSTSSCVDYDYDARYDLYCGSIGDNYGYLLDTNFNIATCESCDYGWQITSGDATIIGDCCGDDAGENYRTRVCTSGCTSSSADDACCNSNTDCVYNGVCYSNGQTYSNLICSNGNWVLNCYPLNRICASGSGCTTSASDTACCDQNSDCVYSSSCYNSASCYSNDYYCGASNTWYGSDQGQTYCNACVGTGRWNIGGEVAATTCCGDDSGENYRFRDEHISGAELWFDDDASDNACCNNNLDCVYGNVCYSGAAYDINGDGSKEAFCHGTYGTWLNVDYHNSYCGNAGYNWNVGYGDATGDNYAGIWGSSVTVGYCNQRRVAVGSGFVASKHCCCGDDSGEYYRSGSATLNAAACCNSNTDCVDASNVCRASGYEVCNGNDYMRCNSGSWQDVGCCQSSDCSSGQYCRASDYSCQALPGVCKKANAGFGYTNQAATEDIYGHCTASWTSCDPNKCVRRGPDGFCDGAGACDTNDRTGNIVSGYVCTGSGTPTPVSSTNYCNYDENCDNGDCSATQWWTSCNGAGACRAASDHTDSASQAVTATNSNVLRNDCTQQSPSTSIYCGYAENCANGDCSATQYYRACNGAGVCRSDNTYAATQSVYASTGYTLTASCGTTGTTLCGYSGWNKCGGTGSPYSCQKGRDQLRCNGAGSCNSDVGDDWTNVASAMVCNNGNEVAGSCTYRCGYSSWNQCDGYCEIRRDCFACSGSNTCSVDVGNNDQSCPANTGCSGGSCSVTSESGLCNDGIDNDCDGEKDWDTLGIRGPEKGDNNCPVGVTSISGPSPVCPGETFEVTCTSTVANVNSVSARIDGQSECNYDRWSGSNAIFDCTAPLSTSTYTVRCYVDTSDSYKSGSDRTYTLTVGGSNCCSQYSTSGICEGDSGCDWCAECSGRLYSGGSDRCVSAGSCNYYCWRGECSAVCDGTQGGCTPTECDNLDGCYNDIYRDYHDMTNTCLGSCTCQSNSCTSYTPEADNDNDGYSVSCGDCNDNDGDMYLGNTEVCDNKDNDCDGYTDEGISRNCGSGVCAGTQTCSAGSWGACSSNNRDCGVCAICNSAGTCVYDQTQDGDCSATNCPADGCGVGGCGANIFGDYPVSVSNQCSGRYTCTSNSCTASCEADNDNDGYSVSCGDCNDNDGDMYLGNTEVCDNKDNDCDGYTDEVFNNENCRYYCQNNGYTWTGNGGSLNCCGNDGGEDSPYQSTETSCSDGRDNDCNSECDYDSSSCSHGDSNCPVGVSNINGPSPICPGEAFEVTCTSTVANVNSVSARIDGESSCSFDRWSGSNAIFDCTAPLSTSTYTVRCYVDTSKSYKSGSDRTYTLNVGGTGCCGGYSSSGECENDPTCDWCTECSGIRYSGGNDRCVSDGSCSYYCWSGECGAVCDGTQGGCDDYCSGNMRYYSSSCTNCVCSAFSQEDCDDYDCSSGLTCSGVGTSSITESGDDYSCSGGSCSGSGTMTCGGPWSCGSSNECGLGQDCAGVKYCYYDGGYKWGENYPGTETDCSDANDNDCDGSIDCDDSDCDSNNACCELSTALWKDESDGEINTAMEGNTVYLEVTGTSACNGLTVSYEVYENDGLSADDYIPPDPSDATFGSGVAKTSWTAQYVSDPGGPEFYFEASTSTPSLTIQSGDLSVSESQCIDSDADGYGICPGCGIANGCTYDGDDCNGGDGNINPGATEVCDNGYDDDCDGYTDCGDIGDCSSHPACQDCNPSCHPDICNPIAEVCDSGYDDDCDGFMNCADTADCGSNAACQDCNPSCHPDICNPIAEVCNSGYDEDCDGFMNCADTADCGSNAACQDCNPSCHSDICNPIPEVCDSGYDDDCDGYTDCDDAGDCSEAANCQIICVDSDNDGYGVCPDCGIEKDCTYDGDDCNDGDGNINPGATEVCNSGYDDDCNGYTDCADSSCVGEIGPGPEPMPCCQSLDDCGLFTIITGNCGELVCQNNECDVEIDTSKCGSVAQSYDCAQEPVPQTCTQELHTGGGIIYDSYECDFIGDDILCRVDGNEASYDLGCDPNTFMCTVDLCTIGVWAGQAKGQCCYCYSECQDKVNDGVQNTLPNDIGMCVRNGWWEDTECG